MLCGQGGGLDFMSEIFNKQHQKELRQKLRKQPIKVERLLWNRIRYKQLGYKFRRQHGVGKYIVDFYCPKVKFIIEVDGSTHAIEQEMYQDNIRQEYFEGLGLVVKRYTNSNIKDNINEVLSDIINICRKLDKNK